MKIPNLFYLLMLCILLIASCRPDEEVFDPTPGTNSITATIDGKEFSVSGITVTANYSIVADQIHTLSIAGAKSSLDGTTEGIALAIVTADSSFIEEGETYQAAGVPRTGAGEYFFENNSADIRAYSSNTDVATITITKIDYTDKIVSGTFSFDGVDDDDPNTVYQVRDGVFTNVSFD